MFISKDEYERMQERIAELEAKVAEARKEERKAWERYYELYENRFKDFLKDYDAAVLWPKDGHTLKVWNHGRFEKGVRAVALEQESYDYLPQFTIRK